MTTRSTRKTPEALAKAVKAAQNFGPVYTDCTRHLSATQLGLNGKRMYTHWKLKGNK